MSMLAESRHLYSDADDSTRRNLLEAFFNNLEADMADEVRIDGSLSAHVEELKKAEREYRDARTREAAEDIGNEEGPHLSMRAFDGITSVDLLDQRFLSVVSSKATLVDVIAVYSNLPHPHRNTRVLRKLLEAAQSSEPKPNTDVEQTPARLLRRRLGELGVSELISKYEAGSSVKQLAREYSASGDAVLRLLREHGIQRRYQPLTAAQVAEAVRRYEAGQSIYTIARQTGIPKSTVGRALKRTGVQMRSRRGSSED